MKTTKDTPFRLIPRDLSNCSLDPEVRTIYEDGRFKLLLRRGSYDIEAYKLRTAAMLAGWMYHLLGKGWMDAWSLKCFADVVTARQKLEIHSETAGLTPSQIRRDREFRASGAEPPETCSEDAEDEYLPRVTAEIIHRAQHPAVPTIFEDGCFKLILQGRTYDIEASRIRTEAALLGWTYHLAEKRWMDPSSLKRFIEFVSRQQKLDYQIG
jgi:hypothetical protein